MTGQQQYEEVMAWDDLVIAGRAALIDDLLTAIDSRLPSGWSRYLGGEGNAKMRGAPLPGSRCYATIVGGHEVVLWLFRVTNRKVKGGLVETSGARYLPNIAEAIVDFRRRVLEPAASDSRLAVGHEQLGPHSLVPIGVNDALWSLYESCDFQWPPVGEAVRRWRQFVATVYRESAAFDPQEFQDWFVEKGWTREHAEAMFERLVADAAMLAELDEQRQPA